MSLIELGQIQRIINNRIAQPLERCAERVVDKACVVFDATATKEFSTEEGLAIIFGVFAGVVGAATLAGAVLHEIDLIEGGSAITVVSGGIAAGLGIHSSRLGN